MSCAHNRLIEKLLNDRPARFLKILKETAALSLKFGEQGVLSSFFQEQLQFSVVLDSICCADKV